MRKQRNSEKRYILIFNATTLIVLRELRSIELIDRIREHGIAKLFIPQSVREEFVRAGKHIDIQNDDIPVDYIDMGELLLDIPQSLGEGERQAIAIAYAITRSHNIEETVVVVTDDRRARSTCTRIGLKVIGTLGLIELAKKHGVITKDEALRLLNEIPSTSLYITLELLAKARTKIEQQ